MKKALISGYIGFDNFGDEAIFLTLSSHLKSLGYEVSVLCNNKNEVKKRYNVKTYNFKKPLQILKGILSCDCLISGGGSLLQNKTSNFSLLYYLFIIFLAKLCFKKVFIFSQGIEKINGSFFENLTKIALKCANFVSVRDMNSLEYLKKMNIEALLTSDPVYALVQDMEIENQKDGLIVQLRDFKGIDDEFLNDLSNEIVKNYQGEIKVLSLQNDLDKTICERFIQKLNEKNIEAKLILNEDIEKTIAIINKAKFVISTRLHGLIVASALCPNVFGIVYDDKIETLTRELDIDATDIREKTQYARSLKLDEFFNHCLNEVHCKYRRFEWNNIDNVLEN
ncbi:MAG: polysaccharide pyruvyl transferase CsaB [Candidatus Gastranaerophilales bacterium]|nr:polysaccharide pyruvyl transferase CsaB [Candidatus Gastranaerophilales bacterium]